MATFKRSDEQPGQNTEGDEEIWVQTRLIVRLKLSSPKMEQVQQILARSVEAPASTVDTSDEPTVPSTDLLNAAYTTNTTQEPISESSAQPNPPYESQWVDETKAFNMKTAQEDLQGPGHSVYTWPLFFNWFPDAVPINSIFPPGVGISAKEIMAFYPHHIRWKGVTLRLVNNSYLSDTILPMQAFFRDKDQHPLTSANLGQFIRDSLKTDIRGFTITSYKSDPDPNLFTDHLKPKLINSGRHRFVVPTFDDLLKGLVHLPTGIDARDLTQSLVWYLNMRDTFTPPLQLNVLHTQSLVRALRMPSKPYGSQNLDLLGLQEWKEKGALPKRRVEDEVKQRVLGTDSRKEVKRSRVKIRAKPETVDVDVVLRLRHVLTFPYMSIGGMVCKALEMGIEKAEKHKAAREARKQSEVSGEEAKVVRSTSEDVEMQDVEREGPIEGSEQEASTTTPIEQEEVTTPPDASTYTRRASKFASTSKSKPAPVSLTEMLANFKIPKLPKKQPPKDDTAVGTSTSTTTAGPKASRTPLNEPRTRSNPTAHYYRRPAPFGPRNHHQTLPGRARASRSGRPASAMPSHDPAAGPAPTYEERVSLPFRPNRDAAALGKRTPSARSDK